jgi:hypothetical protein
VRALYRLLSLVLPPSLPAPQDLSAEPAEHRHACMQYACSSALRLAGISSHGLRVQAGGRAASATAGVQSY